MKVSNAIGGFYQNIGLHARLGQNGSMHGPCPPRRHALATALGLGLAWHGRTAAAPAAAGAPATVWRVGPGEALTRVAEALARAADGDTITVLPGVYRADVAVIRQRRLRIVGLGERPVLQADGQHAEGKAIWVLRDGDIEIENIAFRGCRVPDGNGAGIRFERGRLRLRNCSFSNNQTGLLTGADPDGELDVAECLFEDAPDNPLSLPHLLYVGRIGLLRLHGSVLRQGRVGHLLKSRAREAVITGNRFDDGLTGEASYEIDLPNGGIARVEGNTLVQSPLSHNSVMLSYGAEGGAWPVSRLTLRDNTFINHRASGGWFVRVWADRLPADTTVLSHHNRLLGPGSLALGPAGRSVEDRTGPAPD